MRHFKSLKQFFNRNTTSASIADNRNFITLFNTDLPAIPDISYARKEIYINEKKEFYVIYSKSLLYKEFNLFRYVSVQLINQHIKKVEFSTNFNTKKHLHILKVLVNSFSSVLGDDIFGKGEFEINDEIMLKEGKWKGRMWRQIHAGSSSLPVTLDVYDGIVRCCIYLNI